MREKNTYNSKKTKEILNISDCKLTHLREEGVLRASKKGNSFLYHEDDIKEYKKTFAKKEK